LTPLSLSATQYSISRAPGITGITGNLAYTFALRQKDYAAQHCIGVYVLKRVMSQLDA